MNIDKRLKDRKPWSFCETPEEKCTMNYCDENGCQNRKRNYVQGNDLIADVVSTEAECLGFEKGFEFREKQLRQHTDGINSNTVS